MSTARFLLALAGFTTALLGAIVAFGILAFVPFLAAFPAAWFTGSISALVIGATIYFLTDI